MAASVIVGTDRATATGTGWRAIVRRIAHRYGLVAMLLVAWEIVGRVGVANAIFFPAPTEIISASIPWYTSGRIWPPLIGTATEIVAGLAMATLFGGLAGIALGRYDLCYALFNPILTLAYSVPIVAFGPSLALGLGSGMLVPILLVFGFAVFPIIFTVAAGVRSARQDLARMAHHFGAREWQIVRDVLVPGAMPYLVGALRVSIGRAVAGAVVGEWLSSTDGLGSLIFSSAAVFETKTTFMVGVTLVMISLGLTWLMRWLDLRFSGWRQT